MLQTNLRNEKGLLFKSLLEEFAGMADREGHSLRPYDGEFPRHFENLPPDHQDRALTVFQDYMEVCREVLNQSGSLVNDQLFLWRMFKKLRVHPPSELMSQILDGDVVEIHNLDYVQVYRNLSSFSLCSYTLDDLLCRPFWHLFQRDEIETERLIELGRKIISNELNGVLNLDMGAHTVVEIDSPGRYLSVVEYKLASPLWDSTGKVVAGITVIRPVSCVRTAPEPRLFETTEVNGDLQG